MEPWLWDFAGRAPGEGRLGGACRAGREQLRGGETSAGVFLTEWVFGFGGFAVSRVCSYLEEERVEKAL